MILVLSIPLNSKPLKFKLFTQSLPLRITLKRASYMSVDMSYHDSAEDSGAEAAEDTEGVAGGRTEVDAVGAEVLGPLENGTRAMEIR